MPYADDITATEHMSDSPMADDEATYCFSTYFNSPEHLPIMTLESVTLGKLTLTREQVIDWIGKDAVARLEERHNPNRTMVQMSRDYQAGDYGKDAA